MNTLPNDTCLRPTTLRRGFNLVEAAIVLGVVGLVIGGIWTAASAVSFNTKVNDTVLLISTVTNNLRTLMRDHRPTTGGGEEFNGTAIMQTIAPATYLQGNNLKTPFDLPNNQISLSAYAEGILLEISGISRQACISLGPRLYVALRAELITSTQLEQAGPVSNGTDSYDISTPELDTQRCGEPDNISVLLRW